MGVRLFVKFEPGKTWIPFRRVRLLFLSADGQINARNEAMAAGADDFLTKPLDLQAVTTIVQNYHPNEINRL